MDYEKIKTTLKKDFIGIDDVIDKIVDSVKTWNMFDKQRKPTVINLWGMTGSGKTDLIRKLVKLLDMEDNFISFNMNDHESFKEKMEQMTDEYSGAGAINKPIVLLDDFHACKTIGKEKIDSNIGMAWDLLDSGIINVKVNLLDDWNMYKLKQDMLMINASEWEKEKVIDLIKDGSIAAGEWGDMLLKDDEKPDNPKAVNLNRIKNIEDLFTINEKVKFFKWNSLDDLNKFLKEATFKDLMNFYNHIFKINKTFTLKEDFSKGLIFVTGNVDELYSSSKEVESDEDPDSVHIDSLNIKYQDLKATLIDHYFRPEHVSRLGSNHIIYPAFSKSNYREIIEHYLEDLNERYETKMTFSKNVVDIIFEESVFASQGVRPVLSAIQYMVENKLPDILTDHKTKKLNLDYKWKKLIVNGKKKYDVSLINKCHSFNKECPEFVRTVVHEAGHAFLYYKLMGHVPYMLVIKNNTNRYSGYVVPNSYHITTRETMEKEIGFYLGGFLAEELIFGSASDGAYSDLDSATSRANDIVMTYGFGSHVSLTKFSSTQERTHANPKDYEEAERILKDVKGHCANLLEENKEEFVKLIKLAHRKCKLTEKDFKKFFKVKEDDKDKDVETYYKLFK